MEAGLQQTPSADRIHIAFFGRRNAGKSSLVNAITNQTMSIVSEIQGTTTDPVRKAMELLPLGAVVIIDTPEHWAACGCKRRRKFCTARIWLSLSSTAPLERQNWKQNWKQICSNSRFPFWRSTINATCTCQNSCQIEQLQSVQKLDSTFRN